MQNITNCRAHAGDIVGFSGTRMPTCNSVPLERTLPSSVCSTYTHVPPELGFLLYVPHRTLLLLYVSLEHYFRATVCASRDRRTWTVSGAWDLSGICFASFMVSPGKVLGSKLPLGFNHFSPCKLQLMARKSASNMV